MAGDIRGPVRYRIAALALSSARYAALLRFRATWPT